MKILLDTCTFLWIALDSAKLSTESRRLFRDPSHQIFLSAVSCWEISVKHALGRLPLPSSPDAYIPRLRKLHSILPLPLSEESALHLSRLPSLHADPFDRMLVCQALVEGMSILTPDAAIGKYPVRCLW